jgi:hypothetical protein
MYTSSVHLFLTIDILSQRREKRLLSGTHVLATLISIEAHTLFASEFQQGRSLLLSRQQHGTALSLTRDLHGLINHPTYATLRPEI